MTEKVPTLTRMTESDIPTLAEHPKDDLGEQAATELGYYPLAEIHKGMHLLGVLLGMGIFPFTNESIESYKREKQRKANSVRKLLCYAGLCAGTAMAVLGYYLISLRSGWGVASLMLGIVIGLSSIMSLAEGDLFVWSQIHLHQYGRPIPKTVIQQALEIRAKVPTAQFLVNELVDKVTIDPFLSVQYGSELYYIAVWDEPSFDAIME